MRRLALERGNIKLVALIKANESVYGCIAKVTLSIKKQDRLGRLHGKTIKEKVSVDKRAICGYSFQSTLKKTFLKGKVLSLIKDELLILVKLKRDLRKSVLRGHPWLYQDSVEVNKGKNEVGLCRVVDKKGEFLAWGFYSPDSALCVRILSLDKKQTPDQKLYEIRLRRAQSLRKSFKNSETNCYRLVNGEGDLLPGFVCDIYNDVAVLQFDGESCYQFWNQDEIALWLLENLPVKTVYFKPRSSDNREPQTWGEKLSSPLVEVKESGLSYLVNIEQGQKTGFFLDQRQNRKYIQTFVKDLKVLNLFSYTGGFSVAAGSGGAKEVTSVDLAPEAVNLSDQNWRLNGFKPENHKAFCKDVFEFLENQKELWDFVIVDPPSMTHSEKTKHRAMESYTHLFAKAARVVKEDQHLVLSSCSSHISFEDFFEIINESLSLARRKGQILQVAGQGFDHPFPHYGQELRYLKFVHLQLS